MDLRSTHSSWHSGSNQYNSNTYLACVCISVWQSGQIQLQKPNHLHFLFHLLSWRLVLQRMECLWECLCLFKCEWTALKQNTGVNKDAFHRCSHSDKESCHSVISVWTSLNIQDNTAIRLVPKYVQCSSVVFCSACFNIELVWQWFHMSYVNQAHYLLCDMYNYINILQNKYV